MPPRSGSAHSECLGQAGLAEDGIGGMPARDADGDREISLRDRAMPDFVAAFALAHQSALRRAQQIAQRAVELWGHSGNRFGFAQCGDLQEQASGIDLGMIVRQQVECHR